MEALWTINGWFQLLRWTHFLAGIVWIGLLYYFNFVQVPFLAKASDATKKEVTTQLLPRALWWFRWGAMVTFIAGLLMLHANHVQFGDIYWLSARGVYITIGSLLGSLMWFNVWFVIWPNQKQIIAAANGASVSNLPQLRRSALMASRTNTMFSIPMLFFMGSSPHGPWVLAQATNTGFLSILGLGGMVWLLLIFFLMLRR